MNDFSAPRLFVETPLPGAIALDGKAVNYLRNVLRLGPGARFKVFNGKDGEFSARIDALDKKAGRAVADAQLRPQSPAPTLTLAFAPLKQARLDFLVEKAAEMGAGTVVPVLTQHGQVRRINKARLRANMIEACEQCGTLSVPVIVDPVALESLLGTLGDRTLVVADEALASPPEDNAPPADPVAAIRAASAPLVLLVGPEGGFSDRERGLFGPHAVRIGLGPRILRADTAAVALLALVEAAQPSVA